MKLYYDKKTEQWICQDLVASGHSLPEVMRKNSITELPAGQILKHKVTGVCFQTLLPIKDTVKNKSLVYYEPGSIVKPYGMSHEVSKIFAGDCRFLTRHELLTDMNKRTV